MQIVKITLENIRSFAFAIIPFQPGTTALVGPNGAGKSTILQAMGWALFDSKQSRQDRFIRDGAQQGTIEVQFISDLDGLEYHVIRELKRKGGGSATLYSQELDAVIATGVRDVQKEISRHLGLLPGIKPATLFEGAIGIPQGRITADFDLPPVPRKTRFEDLLALSSYEVAFRKLSQSLQYGREQLAGSKGKWELLDAQLSNQGNIQQLAKSLKYQKETALALMTDAQQSLTKLCAERERMDQLEQNFDRTHEALQNAKHELGLAQERAIQAESRLQGAQQAIKVVEQSSSGHQAYDQADSILEELEDARIKRDGLQKEISKQEIELGRYRTRLSSLETQIIEAEQAKEKASLLKPKVAQQKRLEQMAEDLRVEVAERHNLLLRIQELQQRLSTFSKEQEQRQTALQELSAIEQTFKEAQNAYRIVQAQIVEAFAQIAALESQLEDLRKSRELLEQGETTHCPVCNRALTEIDRQTCLTRLLAQIDEIQQSIEKADEERQQCQLAEQQSASTLESTQDKFQELQQTQMEFKAASQSVTTLEIDLRLCTTDLDTRAEVETELAQVKKRLAKLGDPRSRHHSATTAAAKLPDLQTSYDRGAWLTKDLRLSLRGKQEQLAPYADLDKRMLETRETLAQNRQAYEDYQRYAPLAAEIDLRGAEDRGSRLKVKSALAILSEQQKIFEGIDYQPIEHTAVREHERESQTALAEIQADYRSTLSQLIETEKRLAEFKAMEQDKKGLEDEIQHLTQALDLLGFLRTAIRDVGPELSRRLLAPISRTANEIYADLMGGDRSAQLIWSKDYGILLQRGPYTSEFNELSGGEQMRAALAVRLALLREMSDVRIAFFDEPTINLDLERRQSLAEQLGAIQGFEQLVVATHDDSFKSTVENIIRVSKDKTGSHITIGEMA